MKFGYRLPLTLVDTVFIIIIIHIYTYPEVVNGA